MLALSVYDIDTLNGMVHSDCTLVRVDVRPLQTAYLTDAQTCGQTDIDAKVAECEILLDEIKYFLVVCHRQHLNILVAFYGWIFDVPFLVVHPAVLHSELHHHPQHNQHILYRLDAKSPIEFLQHKFLHKFFTQSLTIAKRWQYVVLQN